MDTPRTRAAASARGAPDGEEVHSYIDELASSIRTYLYGRRMYETMVYWETFPNSPEQPAVVRDWARQWQSAEKIVFSRTLTEPRSARTRIEREFDPAAIRRLKAESAHDISVDGPEIAAQAIAAGLVDEFQPIVCPVLVGGGKRFFPDGVTLKLDLVETRPFGHSGVVVLRNRGGGEKKKKKYEHVLRSLVSTLSKGHRTLSEEQGASQKERIRTDGLSRL